MPQQGQSFSSGSALGKLRDASRREPAVGRQVAAPHAAADRPATKDMEPQSTMREHVFDLPDPLGMRDRETEALGEVTA